MTIYMDNLMFSDREGKGPPPAIKPSGTPESLPVSVDDYWSPSGYMGDGEVGGILTTCPQRPESAVGVCHGFNWMPVDDGPGWAGVYWQYPENNWGEPDENGERLPGLTMPAGAQSIRFSAWGETGTEVVSFAAGLANIDGFSVERADIALTDEPVEYVIDLRNAEYTTIVGAFSWSASSVGGSRFHIDDIHYSAEPPEGDAPPPMPVGPPEALPVVVDDYWSASGYMGDGESGGITDVECDARAGEGRGLCHHFVWTPTEATRGWAGVYWQYPENNWGDDGQDGLLVPAGAQSIRFHAWGGRGGEVVTFGAGIMGADGFNASLQSV